MNRTVYYEDPYCDRLNDCRVASVEKVDGKLHVVTDQTIFYPECGGQPGDRGILECPDSYYDILDTQKAQNGDSILILDASCKVTVGEVCSLVLEWSHRYKFMVIHTAQHMLSGLLFTYFGIGTVSVHQGEDYLTIETDCSEIDSETIERLISIANIKIQEGHKVVYHEMSHAEAEKLGLRRSIKVEGDVRIVEICDVDRIACGGVQVANTSEIQLVSFYGQEQIRGHVRLFFRVGNTAIQYYEDLQKKVNGWISGFGCSIDEFGPKLEKLTAELSQAKLKLQKISSKLAIQVLETHVLESGVATFTTDVDLAPFTEASEKYENLALAVVNENHWLVVLKGQFGALDFNGLRKNLFGLCGAKGGGRTPVFQGVLDPSKSAEFLAGFKDFVKSI